MGEESTEVIVAAKNDSDDEFVYEVADLAYHVLVLMANRGISVAQVKTELAEREGLMSKTKERRDIKKNCKEVWLMVKPGLANLKPYVPEESLSGLKKTTRSQENCSVIR